MSRDEHTDILPIVRLALDKKACRAYCETLFKQLKLDLDSHLSQLRKLIRRNLHSVGSILEHIVKSIDYHTFLTEVRKDSSDRWSSVTTLIEVAKTFEKGSTETLESSLQYFMKECMTCTSRIQSKTEIDWPKLRLSTIHSAKGREFPVVIATGLDSKVVQDRDSHPTEERYISGVE